MDGLISAVRLINIKLGLHSDCAPDISILVRVKVLINLAPLCFSVETNFSWHSFC